jgi:hypothetical protein
LFRPSVSGLPRPVPDFSGKDRLGRPGLFGLGDIRDARAVDESVAVNELEITAKTLALTALRFCGYKDE